MFLTKVSEVFIVTAFGFVGSISFHESRQFSNIPDHTADACMELTLAHSSYFGRSILAPDDAASFVGICDISFDWIGLDSMRLVWIGLGRYNPSLAAIKTNHLRQYSKNHLLLLSPVRVSDYGPFRTRGGNAKLRN